MSVCGGGRGGFLFGPGFGDIGVCNNNLTEEERVDCFTLITYKCLLLWLCLCFCLYSNCSSSLCYGLVCNCVVSRSHLLFC